MDKTNNFIDDIISADLASGKHSAVITRFPPEPNGYLHIGHAKALCINFGAKEKYNGKCNLRYDDTNPSKEDVEYVESIKKDIKWLGFKWDEELYASDYFEKMYDSAVLLIQKGLAYVCDLSAEDIRSTRGTLTAPGKDSPYRNRAIEENLKLFKEMRDGKYADGEKVLRAKIDMASPNINMRDPVIYRIVRDKHHRTGDNWIIYPMYDFAHPLEDAYEGITHSLCTLEFEDHRPLYDFFKINCGFVPGPRQIEFARLNMKRTIMSKRYLKKLVDDKVVSGWSDPRMPTLSGMRERCYPPEAIRDFCEKIGVSKANSEVDPALMEHCIRERLNAEAARRMVVRNPIKLTITDMENNEIYTAENVPSNPAYGSHKFSFSGELYIDGEDFSVNPPPKYKRLTVGGTVRLKNSYIVEYASHTTDKDGNVDEIFCTHIKDSKSGGANAGIKVKGVIQWVNRQDAVDVTLHEYDYLLTDGEGDFNERLNPNSHRIVKAKGENALKYAEKYRRFQFMRMGYYGASRIHSEENCDFVSIVGLKDGYKIT